MKLLALAFAAALTACGGGGGSSAASQYAPSIWTAHKNACTNPTLTVQLFGDSTMIGISGVDHQIVSERPSMILQGLLDAKYGTCYVGVIDHSGGYTAADAINGTDHFNVKLSDVTPADVNVFNHGLNDQYAVSAAAYAASLEVFATYGSSVGSVNIFETAAESIGPLYTAAIRAVSKGAVADLAAYALTVAGLSNYFPDRTHGTQEWYRIEVTNVLAPAVEDALDAIIKGGV